jgi:hypothetical protein
MVFLFLLLRSYEVIVDFTQVLSLFETIISGMNPNAATMM